MIWTNPTIPSDDLIWWSDPIWSDPMNDAGFDNTKFNVHVTLFITYCQCLASFSTVLVWRSGEIQTTLLSPLQEDGSNLLGERRMTVLLVYISVKDDAAALHLELGWFQMEFGCICLLELVPGHIDLLVPPTSQLPVALYWESWKDRLNKIATGYEKVELTH